MASRVNKGGHNIPELVIERRYAKGIKNFSKYLPKADDWYIYDNSGAEYVLVAKSIAAQKDVVNFEVYNKLINDE